MGKNEQSVGKKGWQSFNAEDNTHSSSSDLLHLLREYIVLAKPKNCPSILAKTRLYLDQEKRESCHTLKTQSFAWTLLVSPPLLSKKSLCLSYLPKHSSFHPSHIPFQIFRLSLQLLLPPSTVLPAACWASHQPLPLLVHGLSGLTLVESHMTSGLLQSATGTDQAPVKSHYLLPERWHNQDCSAISRQPEFHPNTLATVFPTSWL